MADGKVIMPFGRFLGYDRGPDGKPVINQEEAETVRRIYRLFLAGSTPYAIAKELTADGIPTPAGKTKWPPSTVRSILTNEKYKGDALLQKTFTPDYLTKKIKKNTGQIPQYYVEESHPAIITPEIYEAVQDEIERRSRKKSRYSGADVLAGKLICGECGSCYSPKVWHSTDRYRRVIYQCGHKYNGSQKCSTPHLTAEQIKEIFVKAVNEMITNKDEIISNLLENIETASDMSLLEQQRDRHRNEMEILAGMMEQLIAENARKAQNQKEYNNKYNSLMGRYENENTAYNAVTAQIDAEIRRIKMTENFIQNIRHLGVIPEFDEELWSLLVDSVIVYSKDDIRVEFKK